MESHLARRLSSFRVANLRNSALLGAIGALNLNILHHNLLPPESIRGSLGAMKPLFSTILRVLRSRYRAPTVAVISAAALSACGGPETMIASSILSAAMRTTIEQAAKNRPTPEQLWHEAQVARLERRAVAGDAEAQFEIGTYYLLLQEPVAQQWICAAANGGHAKAQLQYGHWFNEDRFHGHCDDTPRGEFEATFHAVQQTAPTGVGNQ